MEMFEVVAEGTADASGAVDWDWVEEDIDFSFCSVCDASPDHGAAGCPAENRAWDDGFEEWEAARGVTD